MHPLHSKKTYIRSHVASVLWPTPKTGGHWFSTNVNHQPGANGGGPSPPILAPKTEMRGGGQKVQKCSKESTFDVFCTEFSLIWDRKSQFFRALRARSIIHSLQLGSHPRLGPKVACFYNMCPKMSKTHQKTHESHPKRQTPTYTAKNNVFHSVQENFFGSQNGLDQ